MADFEWDAEKESLTASQLWDRSVVEKIDRRRDYAETRIIAIGLAERHVLVVVYTWRGQTRRIISARKANSRERELFEKEIARRNRAPPD
jgi:uncharacterized protein